MSGVSILYFAYGSNLLLQRLKLEGYKTIKFNCIARLDDFSLNFGYRAQTWEGAVATISPSPGDHVWGAVWTMDKSEIPLLDKQEGVFNGIYEQFDVDVHNGSNCSMKCRTYRLLKVEPSDHKPSTHYLDVIVRGAIQCGLPGEYIEKLKGIEHNGFDKPLPIIDKLNKITYQ